MARESTPGDPPSRGSTDRSQPVAVASPTSRRRIAIAGGNESVVLFVQWLELDDDMLLEGIRLQRGGLPLASIASACQAAAAKFLANN